MIAWIGTLASILGSFMVATHIFIVGYMLFLLGSVCWLYVGFQKRDNALMLLNGVFFVANIVGLYNAL